MFKVHILVHMYCTAMAKPICPSEKLRIARVTHTLVMLLAQSVKAVATNLSGSTWMTSPNCCNQAQCPHEHTSYQGSMRFIAGDVWDDIKEVCDDCGANLDKP